MKLKKKSKYLNEMIKGLELKLDYLMTREYDTDLQSIRKHKRCLEIIKDIESSYQLGEITREEAEEVATEAFFRELKR